MKCWVLASCFVIWCDYSYLELCVSSLFISSHLLNEHKYFYSGIWTSAKLILKFLLTRVYLLVIEKDVFFNIHSIPKGSICSNYSKQVCETLPASFSINCYQKTNFCGRCNLFLVWMVQVPLAIVNSRKGRQPSVTWWGLQRSQTQELTHDMQQ